jgi:hypothetical protein
LRGAGCLGLRDSRVRIVRRARRREDDIVDRRREA